MDLYLSKIPQEAKKNDVFYLRPVAKLPADPGAPWYTAVSYGKEMLRKMIPDLRKEAGTSNKTYNSLRATDATELFQSDVPEKVIQSCPELFRQCAVV